MAVGHSVEPDRWQAETDRLLDRMAGRFARVETRRRARRFLLGLLADLPRKNCWTIAEHAGDADPHGMQYLLGRAAWDTDGVRDDLRDYVTTALGDTDAVLVVDETGDLKKGVSTVGVQRQYTGTAGRIENAQVAVYLTYAGARGHAMIDRELYLPQSWTDDPERCARGRGARRHRVPHQARAGHRHDLPRPRRRGAGAVGGRRRGLRRRPRPARRAGTTPDRLRAGHRLRPPRPDRAGPLRADALTAGLPQRAWQRLSAGAGAKGQRYYDWALDHPDPTSEPPRPMTPTPSAGGCWSAATATPVSWRSTAATAPQPVPLRELVRVAGRRWTVEESFQAGKGLAGLDEHQVRRWTSWQRWTLFAMLAHALLAVIAAHEHTTRPAPAGLIALTCNEIRRLFTVLVIEPSRVLACPEAWSTWRRRHQHRARTSHYQRQEAALAWP